MFLEETKFLSQVFQKHYCTINKEKVIIKTYDNLKKMNDLV